MNRHNSRHEQVLGMDHLATVKLAALEREARDLWDAPLDGDDDAVVADAVRVLRRSRSTRAEDHKLSER